MSELPKGWMEVAFSELFLNPVDDIVDGPFGSNLKSSEYSSMGIPLARLQNVDRNQFVLKNLRYVTEEKAEELRRHTFGAGDILITKLGDPLGKACIVPRSISHGVLVADVVRARLNQHWVNHQFLCYQINSDQIVEQFKDQTKGTTRPRVNLTKIRALQVRICSGKEQSRIVAKLEELLTDLDAGVAELKAAQKKLAQYRQSLLKAVVEGALTADWRARNPAAETGAQLLERILKERRARWEAKQLAKFADQGKTAPKDWQKAYPEPVKPDTAGLPELPEGWVWGSVEQLSEFVTSGSRGWADYYSDAGATFIRSQNINKDRLDLSDIAYVKLPPGAEGLRTRVLRDDVLLTITGANVGKVALVEVELAEAYVSQHVALIRLVETGLSGYLQLFLTTVAGGRGQLNKEAYGAGKPGLNLQQVTAVHVPLAGSKELLEIIRVVGVHFSAISAQESAIAHSLQQASAQRQNILRSAFAGQLVPQDPNDEPASVLLERIRAERASSTVVKKPRGRGPKSREV